MITNIWLKSQPNKKIPYPDCYPRIYHDGMQNYNVSIKDIEGIVTAEYEMESVKRVEFRP